jgi:hypothetical protein
VNQNVKCQSSNEIFGIWPFVIDLTFGPALAGLTFGFFF